MSSGILPASIELRADATAGFTLQAGDPGVAGIIAEAPGLFDAVPLRLGLLAVRVVDPTVTIDRGCGDLILFRDTQQECRRSSPLPVTIRSEDPSRVLVSAVATEPGLAQVTTSGSFYVQALGTFGTTELVFTAPGAAEARIGVALRPAEIRVPGFPPATTLQMPASGTQELRLGLARPGSDVFGDLQPRPGLQVPVTFDLTPSGVVTVTPARLNFTSGFGVNTFTLRAVSPGTPGTTVLRINAEGYPEIPPIPIRVGN